MSHGPRVPLPFKLMTTYLVVAGLVFLPAFFYLRSVLVDELRQSIREELDAELSSLRDRLSAAPPDRLQETATLLIDVLPQRLTIVDPAGRVLADSENASLGNHADRPEIRDAMANGYGTSLRLSDTTRESTIYAAMRFPAQGPARGVVRIAVPTNRLDTSIRDTTAFLNRTGAVSLSAAVLLSLVAALVVSRPLRRIVVAARAYAAGDFGHPVGVDSGDELGEAAQALADLAQQLRGRLLASGANRATLHALLDDLPVGVILFDARGSPQLVSARARELCGLAPRDELESLNNIAQLGGQAEAIRRVLKDGTATELPLELPWMPGVRLGARWVAIYGPDGEHQPALVVSEEPVRSGRCDLAAEALRRAASKLRDAARRTVDPCADPAFGAQLARAADAAETAADRVAPPAAPTGSAPLKVVELGALVAGALDDLRPMAEAAGIAVERELPQSAVRVVELQDRARRALRRMLEGAMENSGRGSVLLLRGTLDGACVRLTVRRPGNGHEAALPAPLVDCLGGSEGCRRDADGTEAWVALPRA